MRKERETQLDRSIKRNLELEAGMDCTRVTDELIDAGFQALDSNDPAAFIEWRRRVVAALGPDHVYSQLFEVAVDNKSKNSALTDASILTAGNGRMAAQNKRVA